MHSAGPGSSPPIDPPSKIPRLGVPSHLSTLLKIAQDHIAMSLDSERTWKSYLDLVASKHEDRRRFVRINPALLDAPPKLDDVAAMYRLETEVKGWVKDNYQIQRVALQLVATMFYFQITEINDFEGQGATFNVKGEPASP